MWYTSDNFGLVPLLSNKYKTKCMFPKTIFKFYNSRHCLLYFALNVYWPSFWIQHFTLFLMRLNSIPTVKLNSNWASRIKSGLWFQSKETKRVWASSMKLIRSLYLDSKEDLRGWGHRIDWRSAYSRAAIIGP